MISPPPSLTFASTLTSLRRFGNLGFDCPDSDSRIPFSLRLIQAELPGQLWQRAANADDDKSLIRESLDNLYHILDVCRQVSLTSYNTPKYSQTPLLPQVVHHLAGGKDEYGKIRMSELDCCVVETLWRSRVYVRFLLRLMICI